MEGGSLVNSPPRPSPSRERESPGAIPNRGRCGHRRRRLHRDDGSRPAGVARPLGRVAGAERAGIRGEQPQRRHGPPGFQAGRGHVAEAIWRTGSSPLPGVTRRLRARGADDRDQPDRLRLCAVGAPGPRLQAGTCPGARKRGSRAPNGVWRDGPHGSQDRSGIGSWNLPVSRRPAGRAQWRIASSEIFRRAHQAGERSGRPPLRWHPRRRDRITSEWWLLGDHPTRPDPEPRRPARDERIHRRSATAAATSRHSPRQLYHRDRAPARRPRR